MTCLFRLEPERPALATCFWGVSGARQHMDDQASWEQLLQVTLQLLIPAGSEVQAPPGGAFEPAASCYAQQNSALDTFFRCPTALSSTRVQGQQLRPGGCDSLGRCTADLVCLTAWQSSAEPMQSPPSCSGRPAQTVACRSMPLLSPQLWTKNGFLRTSKRVAHHRRECRAALPELGAFDPASASRSVTQTATLLAGSLPAQLRPVVTTLGGDLASLVRLKPTAEGAGHLAVSAATLWDSHTCRVCG